MNPAKTKPLSLYDYSFRSRARSRYLISSGTGVPPVDHAPEALATVKLSA
jgi:hypothetical protein